MRATDRPGQISGLWKTLGISHRLRSGLDDRAWAWSAAPAGGTGGCPAGRPRCPDQPCSALLSTNRADLLERALAQRPGRVDHAALLPLPDAEARSQLIRLYQGRLQLDLTDPDTVITRTDGVTASFIKELLRRAALFAAESADQATGSTRHDDQPLRVTDEHLTAALDQLLDTRNELTRLLLGSRAPHPPQHEPGGFPGGTP